MDRQNKKRPLCRGRFLQLLRAEISALKGPGPAIRHPVLSTSSNTSDSCKRGVGVTPTRVRYRNALTEVVIQ